MRISNLYGQESLSLRLYEENVVEMKEFKYLMLTISVEGEQ